MDFIRPYEGICCSLVEQIQEKNPNIYVILNSETLLKEEIKGIFTWGPKGEVVFCCLPYRDSFIKEALISFFRDRKIFCISGAKEYADQIISALYIAGRRTPSELREMLFMTCSQLPQKDKNSQYRIELCREEWLDELFPMQMDYMQKEVMPLKRLPSAAAERMSLSRYVKQKSMYVLLNEGKIVSKINISARTQSYAQIGGVYTHPDYRNHGYGRVLISHIINAENQQGRKSVLFVKKDNASAIKCYLNAGFEVSGIYSIAYYL